MKLIEIDGKLVFYNIKKDKPTGVYAKKVRNRWQYRSMESDQLIASGMTPKEFVKEFWYREDFQE